VIAAAKTSGGVFFFIHFHSPTTLDGPWLADAHTYVIYRTAVVGACRQRTNENFMILHSIVTLLLSVCRLWLSFPVYSAATSFPSRLYTTHSPKYYSCKLILLFCQILKRQPNVFLSIPSLSSTREAQK